MYCHIMVYYIMSLTTGAAEGGACLFADFVHGGKYPHDDQLDDFLLGRTSSCAGLADEDTQDNQ